jgi:hypothetical protein
LRAHDMERTSRDVQEQVLLRDVLFALQAIESRNIYFDTIADRFQVAEDDHIPSRTYCILCIERMETDITFNEPCCLSQRCASLFSSCASSDGSTAKSLPSSTRIARTWRLEWCVVRGCHALACWL